MSVEAFTELFTYQFSNYKAIQEHPGTKVGFAKVKRQNVTVTLPALISTVNLTYCLLVRIFSTIHSINKTTVVSTGSTTFNRLSLLQLVDNLQLHLKCHH